MLIYYIETGKLLGVISEICKLLGICIQGLRIARPAFWARKAFFCEENKKERKGIELAREA